MTVSKGIRQFHRWVSIAFTLAAIGVFAAPLLGAPAEWVFYLPLLPLALLLISGLCLFVLPYRGRVRRAPARATEREGPAR